MSLQSFPADPEAPGSRQPEHRAIRPWHHLPIHPFAQPAAAVLLLFDVRSQRDPGKKTPDLDIVDDIEVSEYFGNRPFMRGWLKLKLFLRKTEK